MESLSSVRASTASVKFAPVNLHEENVQRVKFASEKSLLEKSQPENATSANEAREKSQAV